MHLTNGGNTLIYKGAAIDLTWVENPRSYNYERKGGKFSIYRLVAGLVYGFKELIGMEVHHVDLDRHNCCAGNLVIMSPSDHTRVHKIAADCMAAYINGDEERACTLRAEYWKLCNESAER